MPAEFMDDAMRNFFRKKFEHFRENGLHFGKNVVHINLMDIETKSIHQEMEFCQEYLIRSLERQYLRCKSSAEPEEAEAESVGGSDMNGQSDGVSLLVTDKNLGDSGSMISSNPNSFNSEVQRAQKNFIDAREASLIEWELRDLILSELVTLCASMKGIVSGKH